MKRKLKVALSCAVMLTMLAPLTAVSQTYGLRTPATGEGAVKQKMKSGSEAAGSRLFAKNYPALCLQKYKHAGQSTAGKFVEVKHNESAKTLKKGKQQKKVTQKAPVKKSLVANGRELYGNVIYSGAWDEESRYGLYKFNASDPVSPSYLWTNDWCIANGGGALVDDIYHTVNWSQSGDGYVSAYYRSFDVNSGEILTDHTLSDISLIATEVATASDGTVYGEFYNSTGTGYELGIADYNNYTHTTIGALNNWYIAMGITSDKKIYAITADGNLYRINAETAEETLVGSTGLDMQDSDGGTYTQSGEIDTKSGIFYWASVDPDGNSKLYTVDLATATPTLVGSFENNEIVVGLSVPKPLAEDGAPAAVSSMDFNFVDASLTGTITFTAPETTFAGDALSGEIKYSITCDGDTVAVGKTQAGAEVKASVAVQSSGMHTFVVCTSNSVGKSPETTQEAYIGYDEPNWVENVSISADSNGKVTLNWDAPTYGVNWGYLGDLTYRITRYPDDVVVAENCPTTTFSETLTPDELTIYYYNIAAVNGDVTGTEVSSKTVVVGPAIELPYDNTFADSSALDLMTIIDSNEDGITWEYHWEQACASCAYSDSNNANDWLVTPPLKVEKNKMYKIRFTASPMIEDNDLYSERIEVKLGKGSDPTTYETVVLDPTEITKQTEFTYSYLATEDADIKIAFHAISDPDHFNLLLREVHMSAGSELTAPAAVSNFTVTPDSNGKLNASVSCTLPDKTVEGKALTSLSKVELYRNGEVEETITDNINPGAALTRKSSVDEDGSYTYKIVCYNESGAGIASEEVSAYVGLDQPGAIDASSIKAVADGSKIKVTWDAVTTGKHGGYVDPSQITYTLYSSIYWDEFYGYEFGDNYGTVTGTNSCTVDIDSESGDQMVFSCYVLPENEKGYGTYGSLESDFLLGKSIDVPFTETFDGGLTTNYWIKNCPDWTNWDLISDYPSADGGKPGVAYVSANNGDSGMLATGKIAPNGASNLKTFFSINAESGANIALTVQVQKADMTIETLKTFEVNATSIEDGATTGWTTYEVPMAAYANEKNFLVRFVAAGEGLMYLDNVEVRSVYQNDLAVASVTVPDKVKKGSTANVEVKVKNVGEKDATGFTVRLLANGKTLSETAVNEILEPNASSTVSFTYAASAANQNKTEELVAEVVYANDEDSSNNQASATITLASSGKQTPADANCDVTSGTLVLNWTAPDTSEHEVTDGFESYDTWTADEFGEWTSIDKDKAYTGSMFNDYAYGHQGEQFAFEVFEPTAIFDDILDANPDMAPHSGNKYAAAIFGNDEYGNWVDGDNWLISPTLSGKAQTVKFYANNCGADYEETMEVYYTNDGENFELVDSYTLNDGNWKEISFDVPEGATNFAIRQTSYEGGYILGIDDVTYVAGSSTLTGFNIYRDGELIATVAADATTFTDTTNDGSKSALYAITAVYADGESSAATVDYVPGSVEQLEATDGEHTFTVYGPDGKLYGKDLKTIKNLSRGIYIVNGQKVVIK